MALFKEKCGHPTEWNTRLIYDGRVYTYCMGCIMEKLGLDNLEEYNCPFIKSKKETIKTKPTKTKKEED